MTSVIVSRQPAAYLACSSATSFVLFVWAVIGHVKDRVIEQAVAQQGLTKAEGAPYCSASWWLVHTSATRCKRGYIEALVSLTKRQRGQKSALLHD